ncbi:glycoside hydrolase family 19 protein [Sphingomonas sp. ERG5]|uniref:glycoside hydrolase family 19 protein n=1 Tax=Sphingomonas sp. ERG5 TaxID=1381597 RepID=UPI00054B7B0F|nr:glycoside hydrolase [Sphingomonas sp. ERG5]
MNEIDAKRLQARLKVAQDGAIGRATLAALFANAGAGSNADELALAANVHFRTYGILDTPLRLAHFIAQVAHESGGLRNAREIWGPTEAQLGYEGASRLGNDQRGDGLRYLGRGPGGLTGRANYRFYGQLLGIDFERRPELVEAWSIGLLAFCAYWDRYKLNTYADADNLLAVSNGINRGNPGSIAPPNGWADRQARFARAKAVIL